MTTNLLQIRSLQHASVACTLRDAHLLWKAFDDAQPHMQVMAVIVVVVVVMVVVMAVVIIVAAVAVVVLVVVVVIIIFIIIFSL